MWAVKCRKREVFIFVKKKYKSKGKKTKEHFFSSRNPWQVFQQSKFKLSLTQSVLLCKRSWFCHAAFIHLIWGYISGRTR